MSHGKVLPCFYPTQWQNLICHDHMTIEKNGMSPLFDMANVVFNEAWQFKFMEAWQT